MRFPAILGLMAALLMVSVFGVGCDGNMTDGDLPLREEPFRVRAFTTTGPAVCYGPHRDGQRPGGVDPSVAEMREDLAIMAPHWKMIRIYSSASIAWGLLEEIRTAGLDMKVVLGVWIAPEGDDPGADHNREANLSEVEAGIKLANEYRDIVVAVSVGNETQIYWSAHTTPEQKLVEYIRMVRAAVKQPVTTADDFNFWNKPESRLVAGECDFILMHAHPMWNGVQLEEAVLWLNEQVNVVRALHSSHKVVLGETGWATSVHTEGEQARLIKGVPGEAEQKRFHEESLVWAEETGLVMFTFEAFDENWKGGPHPAEVEKHWGLFRADRTPKAVMDPEWVPESVPAAVDSAGAMPGTAATE